MLGGLAGLVGLSVVAGVLVTATVTPAIAVSGPEPLTVVWTNGATQAAPDAPEVGSNLLDELPAFGPGARATIQRLLIGEGSDVNVITHADWIGTFPADSHPAIIYPIAATTTAKPEANDYLAFLRSAAAKTTLEKYGFTFLIKPVS